MNGKHIIILGGVILLILLLVLLTKREAGPERHGRLDSDKYICGQFKCLNNKDCASAGGYCDLKTRYCCLPDRTASQCVARAQQIIKRTGYPPEQLSPADCCPNAQSTIVMNSKSDTLRPDLPLGTVLCVNNPLMEKNPSAPITKLFPPIKWGGKCCPCPASNTWCFDN